MVTYAEQMVQSRLRLECLLNICWKRLIFRWFFYLKRAFKWDIESLLGEYVRNL